MAQAEKWYLQTVSQPTSDSSSSLLAVFGTKHFLFNCGENLSRTFVELRSPLRKVNDVFLTRIDTTTSSGLLGTILGHGEASAQTLNIYGPTNIEHYLASMRLYARRDKLGITVKEIESNPSSLINSILIHDDPNTLTVHAFPILPPSHTPSEESGPLKRKRSKSRSPPVQNADASQSLDARPAKSPDRSTTSEVLPQPIDAGSVSMAMGDQSFKPTDLEGTAAAEWRRLVIQETFMPPQPPSVTGNGQANLPSLPEALLSSLPGLQIQQRALSTFRRSPTSPALSRARLPPPPKGHIPHLVAYLSIGPRYRGRFLPERATELGIQKLDFKYLAKGESVTNGKGERVEPGMVMEKSKDPAAFAVVECPSPEWIPNIRSSLHFDQLLTEKGAKLDTIVHFLGPKVLDDESYREWMKSFGDDVQHIISSPEFCPDHITFGSSATLQLRLSKLEETMFPLLQYSLNTSKELSAIPSLPPKVILPEPTFRIPLGIPGPLPNMPHKRHFNFEASSPEAERAASAFRPGQGEQQAKAWEEFLLRAMMERTGIEQEEFERRKKREDGMDVDEKKKPFDDVTITPLGTGSAVPSKYRNVSSTLIQIPSRGYILLDTGEGTLGQLIRKFGSEGVDQVLRDLKMIFISHLHADHHNGLVPLLERRANLNPQPSDPLYLVAPSDLRLSLTEQSDIFPSLRRLGIGVPGWGAQEGVSAVSWLDTGFLDPKRLNNQENHRHNVFISRYLPKLKALLGLKSLETVSVLHRARCWGLVLVSEDKWKLVYSGDTQPCDALVDAGQGADLLIHEATLEDGKEELARSKGHSTLGEAIGVARRMNARLCLLTHFSQRYPKLPPPAASIPIQDPTDAVTDGNNNTPPASASTSTLKVTNPATVVAFDHMTIRGGEWWKFDRYRGALEVLFQEMEGDEGGDETNSMAESGGPAKDKKGQTKKEKGKKQKQKKGESADGGAPAPS